MAPTTYVCRADHHRLHPVEARFEAPVPMVRLELGQDHTPDRETPLGSVRGADHLLFSVRDVVARFGGELDRPVARVEIITPARRAGSRFSPIALFFGYARPGDRRPSFFIVEAGTADGEASVLYLGRTLDAELSYATGYHPTPWTSNDQRYRSRLTMAADDEPGELVVEAIHAGASAPHLRITARFERQLAVEAGVPAALTAEAALRVMTIGRALGRDVGLVGRAAASLGELLVDWETRPEPLREEGPPSSRAA